jgi:serine/threonine protein phosphatase PrpC
VTGVVDGDLLVLGWVGDSRAYWLPDDHGSPGTLGVLATDTKTETAAVGARVLTVDDSVAAEQIAHGVARDVAESGPQAHAITRWLGVDSPTSPAHTATETVRGHGWVMLCSDGLWNYCSEAADLAALVAELAAAHPTALALSRALVDWAKEQGGHDNITVGLARL